MKRPLRRLVTPRRAAFLLIAAAAAPLHAQTWNGGGGAFNTWGASANWTGGVPVNNGTANVNFGTYVSNSFGDDDGVSNINSNYDINSLNFTSGSPEFTLTGDQLTIEAGGIDDDDPGISSFNIQSINTPVVVNATQTWTTVGGSELEFNLGSGLSSNFVTLKSGASLTLATSTTTGLSQLAMTGATFNTGNNGINLGQASGDGPSTLQTFASSTTSVVNGAINLNADTVTLNVAAGTTPSGIDLSIPAEVGEGSLSIMGGGTVLLSNNNIYTNTLIDLSNVAVGNSGALGTGAVTLEGGGIEANGSAQTLSNPIVLGPGGTIFGSQALTFTGGLSLNAPGQLNLNDTGGTNFTNSFDILTYTLTIVPGQTQATNNTISGSIAGVGNLQIDGLGTVTLSGNSTFFGNLLVEAGTVAQSAGSLAANLEEIGGINAKTAAFNQTAGTNAPSAGIYLGYVAGSTGIYNLNAGGTSATISSSGEFIGYEGIGVFTQNGGSNTSSVVDLGVTTATSGTYNLYVGTLTSASEIIASSGAGTFIQTGGSNTSINPSGLGMTIGNDGLYNLSGGSLSVSGSTGDIVVESGGTFSEGGLSSVTANVQNLGTFIFDGGTFAGQLNNGGGTAIINAGFAPSGGVLNSGTITISSMGSLDNFASSFTNSGTINLGGGTFDTGSQAVTNSGTIQGFGTLITGGLTNNSTLSLAGSSSVSGPVINSTNANILLTGNSPNVFFGTFSNSGTLTVNAGASGTLYGAYSGAGPIVNNGTLYIDATSVAGKVSGGGNLTLGAVGTTIDLSLLNSGITSAQGSLTINPGSQLDITNNALTLNFGSPADDPAALIRSYLQSGYNGDKWNGPGIVSSIAASNPGLYAVGYADGNTDVATPAAANQIYIENTLAGDANLDGIVNFSDLLVVAQDFGRTGQDWAHGDFNYDGIVNFSDLLLVAQNFGKQLSAGQLAELPGSFAAEWQLAQAQITAVQAVSVPEPAAAGLFLIGLAGLLTRRPRKNLPQA